MELERQRSGGGRRDRSLPRSEEERQFEHGKHSKRRPHKSHRDASRGSEDGNRRDREQGDSRGRDHHLGASGVAQEPGGGENDFVFLGTAEQEAKGFRTTRSAIRTRSSGRRRTSSSQGGNGRSQHAATSGGTSLSLLTDDEDFLSLGRRHSLGSFHPLGGSVSQLVVGSPPTDSWHIERPVNPKPLTRLLSRERRHSFGSGGEIEKDEVEREVDNVVREAVARRSGSLGHSGWRKFRTYSADSSDVEYRRQLAAKQLEDTVDTFVQEEDDEDVESQHSGLEEAGQEEEIKNEVTQDTANVLQTEDGREEESKESSSLSPSSHALPPPPPPVKMSIPWAKLVSQSLQPRTDSDLHAAGELRLPIWCKKPKIYLRDDLPIPVLLHQEIEEYVFYVKTEVSRLQLRIDSSIEKVRRSVSSLWAGASVEVFGSFATGLWLPSSDLDLVVMGVASDQDRSSCLQCLQKVVEALRGQPWVASIHLVDTAKVPVVKLQTHESPVPIDITIETASTHSGLIAKDMVLQYIRELPEIFPLIVVLKQFLRERGLNDAYTGGLSSYSIVLMTVFFIQLRKLKKSSIERYEAVLAYAGGGTVPPELLHPPPLNSQGKVNGELKERDRASGVKEEKGVLSPSKEEEKMKPPNSYAAIAKKMLQEGGGKTDVEKKSDPPLSLAASSTTAGSRTAWSKEAASSHAHEGKGPALSAPGPKEERDVEPTENILGDCLIEFLELYGTIFDFASCGISVREDGYVYRLAAPFAARDNMHSPPLLIIDDPVHSGHNVGASTFALPRIISVFEDAYYALKFFRRTPILPTPLSYLVNPSFRASTPASRQPKEEYRDSTDRAVGRS